MAELLKRGDDAWQGLARRERLMVTFTLVVVPMLLIYITVLEPALIKFGAVHDRAASLEQQVASQEAVLKTLQSASLPDHNARANAELKALQSRLGALDTQLEALSQSLVAPEHMLELLRSVLDEGSGLKVRAARSLPVERIGQEPAQNTDDNTVTPPPQGAVYLHPFELELEGSYTALYRYLRRLEALRSGFYWDSLVYDSAAFPKATIRLRVHTLSTKENWLGT